jgi:hypothetical protein
MIANNFMHVQVPDGYHGGAIAISTILNVVLCMLCYGPLFGKSWMRLITEDKSIATRGQEGDHHGNVWRSN